MKHITTSKPPPFTKEEIEDIVKSYPTPFHLYDEEGIRANARKFLKAFSVLPGFKEYFAVKATPNPFILKILKEEGFLGLFNGGSPSTADKDGFVIFGRERKGAPRRLPGKGRETLLMRAMKKVQDVLSR